MIGAQLNSHTRKVTPVNNGVGQVAQIHIAEKSQIFLSGQSKRYWNCLCLSGQLLKASVISFTRAPLPDPFLTPKLKILTLPAPRESSACHCSVGWLTPTSRYCPFLLLFFLFSLTLYFQPLCFLVLSCPRSSKPQSPFIYVPLPSAYLLVHLLFYGNRFILQHNFKVPSADSHVLCFF